VEENQQIGRYEIIERIGRGMQGSVYKARDPELDRLVAIKLLHAGEPGATFAEPDDSEHPIPLEARISSKLRHPNIVSIYDLGRFQGHQYLVFEFVEGQTLRQLLGAQGVLGIEQVCSIAVPIIDAIAYAHEKGVVHLDLSPRNILVDGANNPRIMDFGLSQFAHQSLEQGDEIKGTPIYMSPEYFKGESLGPYTDIYALGASLYQLVTGVPVVDGSSITEISNRIQRGTIDYGRIPPSEHREGFVAVLKACLEKDYRKRVQNGGQLKQLFTRFLSQHPVDARGQAQEIHSTVQFLLRRMQRKADFPSISRVLNDINRLTDDRNSSSAEKLANVILRDYALTNKLLKLVNSAFFAGVSGEISNVSKAIVVLGVGKVRSIANSLAYFGSVRTGRNAWLRDAMIRSFLSGLLTRHLVRREKRGDPEEGFICGLFQSLGENLTAYYFPEDHAEILELARKQHGLTDSTSKRVLGVSYAELGTEVARIWGLPDSIIASIAGLSGEPGAEPETPESFLRDRAVFANSLCAIVDLPGEAGQDQALDMLVARFGETLKIDREFAFKLFAAGMKKLAENADILEFDYRSSRWCATANRWLERVRNAEDAETTAAAADRGAA